MLELKTIDHKDAAEVLRKWEREDFYYKSMNDSISGPLNMLARGNPYLQTKEATGKSEQVSFEFPIQGPIQVVYLDGRSDAGLPHTRGKSGIALPVFLLWNPNKKTMRHELVHLSQKQYRTRWWVMYAKRWNFRPAKETEFMHIPEKWRQRRRINPDTLGTPYVIWKERYIPLTVFISDTDPDLRYCKRGFWDLKTSQWTWEEPPGWTEMFGSGFNDEHPNEIAAHWIDGSAGVERAEFFHMNPV